MTPTDDTRTLTLGTAHHGIKVGDRVSLDVPDRRWWRLLLCRLLRREEPMRRVVYRVTGANRSILTLEE